MRNAFLGLALLSFAASLPGCGNDNVNNSTSASDPGKAGAEAAKMPPPSPTPKK